MSLHVKINLGLLSSRQQVGCTLPTPASPSPRPDHHHLMREYRSLLYQIFITSFKIFPQHPFSTFNFNPTTTSTVAIFFLPPPSTLLPHLPINQPGKGLKQSTSSRLGRYLGFIPLYRRVDPINLPPCLSHPSAFVPREYQRGQRNPSISATKWKKIARDFLHVLFLRSVSFLTLT